MKNNDNLILVNSRHPVPFGQPDDLVCVPDYPHIKLRREALEALNGLLAEIGGTGQIVPVSGYRSREEQRQIYESSLLENGGEFTRKYVARPGCSEHETGLAIDLALNREPIDFIRPDFPYDGICGEFRKLAFRYGFVERYPAGKEQITGIAHEPWHFRYVGCPHSELMTLNAMTLEEYLAYLGRFRGYPNRLRCSNGRDWFEIFCVTDLEAPELPEDCRWDSSGTNCGGQIITLWRNQHGNGAGMD